ncbi:integrase core domain-containing protein [Ammonicoccus fulvus]|uniref:Integrase core domain-containing protein n=1 Tax=Ammonicoccus fulvus TaxID=3138240 RepID=A0ABZ3FPY6_9ACTN
MSKTPASVGIVSTMSSFRRPDAWTREESTATGGGPFRSFRFESFIAGHPELLHVRTRVKTPGQNGSRECGFGTLKYERLYLDEIDDALMLAERAEDYRIEYNELRPHEAISWNRPKQGARGPGRPHRPDIQNQENPAN